MKDDAQKCAANLGRLMFASSHGRWPESDVSRLMATFGSTGNLLSSSRAALTDAGLSDAQMALLMTVNASARRCALQRLGPNPCLKGYTTAAALVRAICIGARGEVFALILMDRQMCLLEWQMLAEGTPDEIILQPSKVLQTAAMSDAACAMFCHNHPAGSPRFSQADVDSTLTFAQDLKTIGMPLVDHYLLAGGQVISMKESGLARGCFSVPI